MSKQEDQAEQAKAASAGSLTADSDVNAKIVTGTPRGDIKDAVEQAREARGETDDARTDDGGAKDTKAAQINYTDEKKARDAAVEARRKHMEKVAGDPEAAAHGGGTGDVRVENADKNEPMYTGVVTVHGVDAQYGKKISTRIDVGPAPKGLGWLRDHAFKHHFPSADVSKGITVDEKNVSDPLLRTQHG